MQRQGEWWAIENIRSVDFGTSLSHFEADLIAVHARAMGSDDFYNPWAFTYEYESDKPYAKFPCDPKYVVELLRYLGSDAT